MDEVLITIPKKKITIKANSVEAAIAELKEYSGKQSRTKKTLINKFFGIAKKGYEPKESDWCQQ